LVYTALVIREVSDEFNARGAALLALLGYAVLSAFVGWLNDRVGGAMLVVASVALASFFGIVAERNQVSGAAFIGGPFLLAGLALLLGVAGMFDLRLLGFMKQVPISVVKGFMPWAIVGFALNLLTGIIFIVSEPAQYFGNPTWWLKVAFLVIAGLNALVFETTYGKRAAAMPAGEDTPTALKVIATVSLISWFGVLWAGRMLPFLGAGVGAGL